MGNNLERFVEAQDAVYAAVVAELRAGDKRGHWMWFIFPQIAGLGHSPTARYYAIASLDEARAYLDHPVLGPRLLECANILLGADGRSAERIFGFPDVLKLRSSMTLFAHVSPPGSVFSQVLDKFYDGKEDPLTLERIS
ncbi:MAG: DUF1810 domain-containing protein [Lentisphaeria bacterium]|nr:DUF1810 domain-containing protein [Lentisphaeria bacterium]